MIEWVVKNAAFGAGLFGLVAAVILAWPLLADTKDRRHWDQIRTFRNRQTLTPAQKQTLQDIREEFLDDRLGNYKVSRFITICGFVALAIAFLLMMVDAATPNP